MKPDLLKFVSADKLSCYERADSVPEPRIRRVITRSLRTLQYESDTVPVTSIFRDYELYDRYLDRETGRLVYEYHEVL